MSPFNEDCVIQFWQMVYEQNVSKIIMVRMYALFRYAIGVLTLGWYYFPTLSQSFCELEFILAVSKLHNHNVLGIENFSLS